MDPIAATPTKPRDYAALSLLYGTAASVVAVAASRREGDPAPVHPAEVALYGVAVAGLARLVSQEKVTEWVRAPFVETHSDGERHPRGSGPRYMLGELLCCTRCLGSWSALGLVGLRAAAPRQAPVAASLLALTYLNDILQAFLTEEQAVANVAQAAVPA